MRRGAEQREGEATMSQDAQGGSFGDLLLHYRILAGLTQEDLAGRSQVGLKTIADLETGRRGSKGAPHPKTVTLLIKALRLTPEHAATFRTAAFRPRKAAPPPSPPLAPDATPSPRERLRRADAAREDARLSEYLAWKYADAPIYRRGADTFPVAVFPAPEPQIRDPESALLPPLRTRIPRPSQLLADASFRQVLADDGRPLHNLSMYAMRQLVTTPTLGLRCELGAYFGMIDTCDALEWELLTTAPTLTGATPADFEAFDRRQQLRAQLHALVADPVRDGAWRSPGISISTLIAYYHKGAVYLMLRKRSRNVALHAGLYHTVPSFMFQPATVFMEDDFAVAHNIYREYLEELFNRPDPVEGEMRHDYFYDDPRLLYLRSLMESGKAELFFTGVTVNLMSLRPDICTVLLIKSEEWYQRHALAPSTPDEKFKLNDEFAGAYHELDHRDNPVPLVGLIPLRLDDEDQREKIDVTSLTTVPCGAAAFWMAVDLLRSLPDVQARIS
jgi:transcriptional regulator with XRE-family HTH domain